MADPPGIVPIADIDNVDAVRTCSNVRTRPVDENVGHVVCERLRGSDFTRCGWIGDVENVHARPNADKYQCTFTSHRRNRAADSRGHAPIGARRQSGESNTEN